MPINLILYGILAVAILGAAAKFHHDAVVSGKNTVYAEWSKADAAEQARRAANLATATERKGKGDAKAKIVYREIKTSVDRYIDRPVYRNVCLDDDGLLDARRAIEGLTPGGPDKPLSKPAPTGERNRGIGLKMDSRGL